MRRNNSANLTEFFPRNYSSVSRPTLLPGPVMPLWDLLQTDFQGCLVPSIADDNHFVFIDHNGLAKAKLANRRGHGVDRLVVVAWVFRIGLDVTNIHEFNFQGSALHKWLEIGETVPRRHRKYGGHLGRNNCAPQLFPRKVTECQQLPRRIGMKYARE